MSLLMKWKCAFKIPGVVRCGRSDSSGHAIPRHSCKFSRLIWKEIKIIKYAINIFSFFILGNIFYTRATLTIIFASNCNVQYHFTHVRFSGLYGSWSTLWNMQDMYSRFYNGKMFYIHPSQNKQSFLKILVDVRCL